jgi:hypothetical protein
MKSKFAIYLITLLTFLQCSMPDRSKDRDFLNSLIVLFKRFGEAEISGTAIKGAVSGAKVRIIPLSSDYSCDRSGNTTPYAETQTDETGNYVVRYPKDGKPVCVVVSPAAGGRTKMFDESLGQNIDWVGDVFLESIIKEPGGLTQKGMVTSPFSRMAARSFAKTMQVGVDASIANSVAEASSRQVVAMFGLNRSLVKASRSNNFSMSSLKNILSRDTSTPSLDDIPYDFSRANDPYTEKFLLVSSGISALANQLAEQEAKSKGIRIPRGSRNSDAIERVINGFADVVSSGGRNRGALGEIIKRATGRTNLPSDFALNPLQSAMQTAILTYLTNSGGASRFGISVEEITTNFVMSSVPPPGLMPDLGLAPSFLSYTDGAPLIFDTNSSRTFFPYIEGGIPTGYTISGTLPSGITFDPNTGTLQGRASAVDTQSVTITGTNSKGSATTTFTINTLDLSQPFAFLPTFSCAKNTSCTITFGVGGILNDNYTITGVAGTLPAGLTYTAASQSLSGIATVTGNFNLTISYTNLNTNTSGSLPISVNIPLPQNFVPPSISAQVFQCIANFNCEISLGIPSIPGFTLISSTGVPEGLTLTAGVDILNLTGVPTSVGTYTISLVVQDPLDLSEYTLNYTFSAQGPEPVTATMTGSSCMADPIAGCFVDYSITGLYLGGEIVSNSTLPEGLTLTLAGEGSSALLSLSGYPTVSGTYTATVTVLNNFNNTESSFPISFTIYPYAPPLSGDLQYPPIVQCIETQGCSLSPGGSPTNNISPVTTDTVGVTYSLSSPYSGLTINSTTGDINFNTSTNSGNFKFFEMVVSQTNGIESITRKILVMLINTSRPPPNLLYNGAPIFAGSLGLPNCNTGQTCNFPTPTVASPYTSFTVSQATVIPDAMLASLSGSGVTLVSPSEVGLTLSSNGSTSGTIPAGIASGIYAIAYNLTTNYAGDTYPPFLLQFSVGTTFNVSFMGSSGELNCQDGYDCNFGVTGSGAFFPTISINSADAAVLSSYGITLNNSNGYYQLYRSAANTVPNNVTLNFSLSVTNRGATTDFPYTINLIPYTPPPTLFYTCNSTYTGEFTVQNGLQVTCIPTYSGIGTLQNFTIDTGSYNDPSVFGLTFDPITGILEGTTNSVGNPVFFINVHGDIGSIGALINGVINN